MTPLTAVEGLRRVPNQDDQVHSTLTGGGRKQNGRPPGPTAAAYPPLRLFSRSGIGKLHCVSGHDGAAMKILVDENIPLARELFGPLGEVVMVRGRDVDENTPGLETFDALAIRSVTNVTPALVDRAVRARLIGTATIGTDHIDVAYIARANAARRNPISVVSAPGSNADSVADYVLYALAYLTGQQGEPLSERTLGIIGCGNCGRRVAKRAAGFGMEVLRYARARGNQTPVLMLTARGELDDRVTGLESGADDFLAKPFAFAELLARVRALLRRGKAAQAPALQVADLILDPAARTVKRGGGTIPLTNREFALLEYFLRNPGRVLTRTMIAEHVWDYSFDAGTNVIDVYVNYLRKKVDAGREPKLIHTVRGVGYVLKAGES
jgi:DNA-binding response OmpR family regulator